MSRLRAWWRYRRRLASLMRAAEDQGYRVSAMSRALLSVQAWDLEHGWPPFPFNEN